MIQSVSFKNYPKRILMLTLHEPDLDPRVDWVIKVYRASKLPLWFGNYGKLEHQIAGIVAACADPHGLVYGILSFFAISPLHLEAVITKTCQLLHSKSFMSSTE
jgi:hypothetical protein